MDIDFVAWAAVIGIFLPLFISLVKQQTWSTQIKKYLAAGVSAVVAVVYTGAAEGLAIGSFSDFWAFLFASFAGIYALAQITYLSFWENTSVEVRLSGLLDRAA